MANNSLTRLAVMAWTGIAVFALPASGEGFSPPDSAQVAPTAAQGERAASSIVRSAAPALASEDREQIQALERRIDALRNSADFAANVPLAATVVAVYDRAWRGLTFEAQDARRLADTLARAARMSDTDRAALAESYAGDARVRELYRAGRRREAGDLVRRQWDVRRTLLGEEHHDTLESMNNLGLLLTKQCRYSEAEPLAMGAMKGRRLVLRDEHPATLTATNNLALLYLEQGRYADAKPLARGAYEGRRMLLGAEHASTLIAASTTAPLVSFRPYFLPNLAAFVA